MHTPFNTELVSVVIPWDNNAASWVSRPLLAASPSVYFKYQYLTYMDTALPGGIRAADLSSRGKKTNENNFKKHLILMFTMIICFVGRKIQRIEKGI
jgi:hypothetical protein